MGENAPVVGPHPIQYAAGNDSNDRNGNEQAEDHWQVRWESEYTPHERHQYDESGEQNPGTDGPKQYEPGRVLFWPHMPSRVIWRGSGAGRSLRTGPGA